MVNWGIEGVGIDCAHAGFIINRFRAEMTIIRIKNIAKTLPQLPMFTSGTGFCYKASRKGFLTEM